MSTVTAGPKLPLVERPSRIDALNGDASLAAPRPEPAKPIAEPVAAAHGPDLRGYVYLTLMILLGSTTSPFARLAVTELPVGILPLLRFGFAGLCVIPFLSDRSALWKLIREDWRRLALVAAFCVPINQGFFLNAARLGNNSHVGLFYALCPLVVWVLAWLLGHEALNLHRLWGVLASIAGVAVIGLGNIWGGTGATAAESHSIMIADVLLIGAVLSWGAYLTLSKPLISRHGAMPVLAGTFLLGCLFEIPIALATAASWLPMLFQASSKAWISLVILAMFVTPLNLALQNLTLRRLDASQVATFSNVAPVLTVVWGVWFFGELLSSSLLIGGLLTLGGVFWTSLPASKQPATVEAVA